MQVEAEQEFIRLGGACLRRYLAQNGRAPLGEAVLGRHLQRTWRSVLAAGMPAPLAEGAFGEPGEMPPEELQRIMAPILAGLEERVSELAVTTRQLVKACLQPEFVRCRESYHEVVDGKCRRQELKRVRERLSGSHCVDCPYWTSLGEAQHRALLARAWVEGGRAACEAHLDIFLPEDFRALRRFVREYRRRDTLEQ